MTALEIYRAQYKMQQELLGRLDTKYSWAASNVFNLTTYDSYLDEYFVDTIIEVCRVILNDHTYEYILNQNNYLRYILVCQLLHQFHWIDWGTSIRGAWFSVDRRIEWPDRKFKNYSKDILDELEWWDDEHHVIESVPFTVENLQALIEFLEE